MDKSEFEQQDDTQDNVLDNASVSSAASAAASSDSAQQPLNELEQRIGELTEALQRERADAMNLRRRHAEELAGLKNHVKADVVRQLMPVIDNFERALKHVPEDLADNGYVKGVQGVVAQFEKTLSDIGVQRIATVGELFNPEYHEAVSVDEDESDDQNAQEIVSDELQAGYKIGDDVVRHAMVRVKLQ
jgi:molecular chaperone GrpE